MKIIITTITIIVIITLAAIFLPIYNGRVICGVTMEGGCWHVKLNLIEYIKYKQTQ